MANKIISYTLMGLGLISIAISSINTLRKLAPLPEAIPNIYISGVGLVLIIIGSVLLMRTKKAPQQKEVPIYHEDKIVGYRILKSFFNF